jgi:ribonuclease VapC
MILDTSAVIAILRDEPEAPLFAKAIEKAIHRRISAVNYVEAAAVIDANRDPIASRRFDDLLQEAEVTVESVTEAQARIARQAYRDFGKGASPGEAEFRRLFRLCACFQSPAPKLLSGRFCGCTPIR